MSSGSQVDTAMVEAIASRERLTRNLDRAAMLAPIGGRGPSPTAPGLAARLASRARYGLAHLFTVRQKRFNLEVEAALRHFAATTDALLVAAHQQTQSLRGELLALRQEQDRARLSQAEAVERELATLHGDLATLRMDSDSLRSELTALAERPAAVTHAELAEQAVQADARLGAAVARLEALVAAEEARARVDVSAHTTGVVLQLDELRLAVEPGHCRPGTWDHLIWAGIVRGIEYELPATFDPTDIILDVGAHIGSFSFACLMRGAGKVFAFETHPHNYATAVTNLSRFGGRGEVVNKAMWRSDEEAGTVRFIASRVPENTGGGNVLPSGVTYHYTESDWIETPAVRFDDFLDELPARVGRPDARVRMLKLDCEGSEFPILLTSRKLHLVDEIVGEFHEAANFPVEPTPAAKSLGVERLDRHAIRDCLESHGFDCRIITKPDCATLGNFHAVRRPS